MHLLTPIVATLCLCLVQDQQAATLTGKVINVSDGDTITILVGKQQ